MTSGEIAEDAGLEAAVPFRFHCHRCGHCCTAGEGYVWLEDGEVERMAGRLGVGIEAFEARHVRTVTHPTTGELRRSLRESSGRCTLLEGANHCSVYTDRPAHCRTFPYWPAVLSDPAAFERARSVCPGIVVEPTAEQRASAFERLSELYERVDAEIARLSPLCVASGVCCRFEEAGHELFATGLEADYAAERHPEAPEPEAPGRCPHHVAGRCTAREGRPLGCRTYFCDPGPRQRLEDLHERFLVELRSIERELGYPASYGRFPEQLRARGIGISGKSAPPDPSEAT